MQSKKLHQLVLSLSAASSLMLLTISLIGWHLMPNGIWGLYSLTDGALAAWNAKSMVLWSKPFDLSPYNIMQGLGSVYIPNTPWLNPGALALSLPLELESRYYLSYGIYFVELLISTTALGLALQQSLVRSLVTAQFLCLFLFPPFTNHFYTLSWISLAPFNAHLMSMCNVVLALFHLLGRGSTRTNTAAAAGICIALASAVYSAPVTFLTYVPVYGIFAALILAYDPTRGSLSWKLGTALFLLLLVLAMGFPEFYATTFKTTMSTLLVPPPANNRIGDAIGAFTEQWGMFPWCDFPQKFLCSDYPIVWIHIAGLIGTAFALAFTRGLERRLAAGMAVLLLFFHIYPVASAARLVGRVSRIDVSFFLFASYTFYAIFSVMLAAHLVKAIGLSVRPLANRATGAARGWLTATGAFVALASVPLMAIWVMAQVEEHRLNAFKKDWALPSSIVRSPRDNIVIDKLRAAAAIRPGGPIRGYTVTYFGSEHSAVRALSKVSPHAPHTWEMYINGRIYMEAAYGNTFMMTDLWSKNIPTLNEYGQWITTPLYVFAKELLANRSDILALREMNVHRLNISVLQAIGVRFIISDIELRDFRLRLVASLQRDLKTPLARPDVVAHGPASVEELANTELPVFLYEIPDANVGTYSPTNVHVRRTASDILASIKMHELSLRDNVVLDQPIAVSNPVPVKFAEVTAIRGGIGVKAQSAGQSLLLLPIQFSRCLKLIPRKPFSHAGAGLHRANLVQTALLFSGDLDAEIRFSFGPGRDSTCRALDVLDYDRLEFMQWDGRWDFTQWEY